ncbi:MAG TPA: M18 family aminopeptidase [Gammaproteobacteria bacterium]|nr:M18 family aminopeptidase [Gammaproteobacteria bacterium]
MTETKFNQGLLDYLSASPSPFHAVENLKTALTQAGFIALDEAQAWQLQVGGKYYVIRNASIIAFTLAQNNLLERGFQMIGAHTDSPCLKVKPNPDKNQQGYFQLGVEVYGGALLNPWFDRDLSLAGRVNFETQSGEIKSNLLDFVDPVAVIPSLAIHLDREANENRSVNKQRHLSPILMLSDNKNTTFKSLLKTQLNKHKKTADFKKILDYELFFYDTHPAAFTGINNAFISSARLDNLLSCYTGLMALLTANPHRSSLLVCNDHEEVGSATASGAQGPFLKSVLERIFDKSEDLARCIHHSMMVSADNAHGVHPNYPDKHDENHGPILNKGPVIKVNANQRYATNSETSALFRQCCDKANVEVQTFVVRSDMACGSTIGPITATTLGVKTIDVGVPTFAMHSIREMAGREDAFALHKVFVKYLNLV